MAEYKFGKVGQGCIQCGRKFADGDKIFSCIVENREGFGREDFCLTCWDAKKQNKPQLFWSRKFDKGKKGTVFNKSIAFDLFAKLTGNDSEQAKDFCYVLALLLMRKRVLNLERTETEAGNRFVVLRTTGVGTIYRIVEPTLSEERLEYIKQNLSSVFEMDV